MIIHLNGKPKEVPATGETATLAAVVSALELRADRIAVELNGEIARRTAWETTLVADGDRLEVVHFVGGGAR